MYISAFSKSGHQKVPGVPSNIGCCLRLQAHSNTKQQPQAALQSRPAKSHLLLQLPHRCQSMVNVRHDCSVAWGTLCSDTCWPKPASVLQCCIIDHSVPDQWQQGLIIHSLSVSGTRKPLCKQLLGLCCGQNGPQRGSQLKKHAAVTCVGLQGADRINAIETLVGDCGTQHTLTLTLQCRASEQASFFIRESLFRIRRLITKCSFRSQQAFLTREL
jgi:hypothetical protein